jgi:O-antigen/teichoic acid export membrane protein
MPDCVGPSAPSGEVLPAVHTFARGTLVVMVVTFFGLGANYLYGIYVARQLGAETFGLYSIGLSLFNLLAILSVMGLDSAVLHFVPGAWAHGRQMAARSALRGALRLGLLTGGAAAAVLWLANDVLSDRVFSQAKLAQVLPFFAAAIPGYVLGAILLSALQAMHDVKWRMLVKYVSEPAVKFAVTAALIWAGWALSGALTGFLGALWLSVLLGGLALRRRMAAARPAVQGKEDGRVAMGTVAKYAMPLLAGMVFNVIASRSDILLIGHFLPASEAGVYAAALQTAGIIVIVLQSVESIIAAPLSESLAHGRMAETRDIYQLSLRWAVIIGAPLVLVATLWPAEILGVFGHAFRDGATAFMVLALAQFVNLATGSANYVLLLSGRSRVVMFNEVINGMLQIFLNLYLIPRHGIVGAAVALLLSVTVVNVLRLIQVRRYLGVQPYDWILLKPVAAAGVGYGAALAAVTWLPVGGPLLLVPLVLMLYGACLLAFGLHQQDRLALASILPGRWAKSENKQ